MKASVLAYRLSALEMITTKNFFSLYPGITLIVDVNKCLEKESKSDILSALKSSRSFNANDIIPECADRYYEALMNAKERKSENGEICCH